MVEPRFATVQRATRAAQASGRSNVHISLLGILMIRRPLSYSALGVAGTVPISLIRRPCWRIHSDLASSRDRGARPPGPRVLKAVVLLLYYGFSKSGTRVRYWHPGPTSARAPATHRRRREEGFSWRNPSSSVRARHLTTSRRHLRRPASCARY